MTIRIENDFCQWLISEDGHNLRFLDKVEGKDWLLGNPSAPCAYVMKNAWRADACQASFDGQILSLKFAGNAGSARVSVETHEAYFVITVLEAKGDFDQLAFINIPTNLMAQGDQPFSASVIALGLQANVEELPGQGARKRTLKVCMCVVANSSAMRSLRPWTKRNSSMLPARKLSALPTIA